MMIVHARKHNFLSQEKILKKDLKRQIDEIQKQYMKKKFTFLFRYGNGVVVTKQIRCLHEAPQEPAEKIQLYGEENQSDSLLDDVQCIVQIRGYAREKFCNFPPFSKKNDVSRQVFAVYCKSV